MPGPTGRSLAQTFYESSKTTIMNKNNQVIKMQPVKSTQEFNGEEPVNTLNLNNIDECFDEYDLDTPEGLPLMAILLEQNQDNDTLVDQVRIVRIYRKPSTAA